MNKHSTLSLLIVLFCTATSLVCTSIVQATTIHVPADSATIQAGINGAVDGDIVLVADGTYTGDGNRDIDFLGKAIVVMSENGPEVTIIDCEGSGRGFNFVSGEVLTSVLKGFTITNGAEIFGGGIYCEDSSPSIIGNTITRNRASFSIYGGSGGGIACLGSSPLIIGNIITGNYATGGLATSVGGGICAEGGSPTIIDNTISGNSAGIGGGIYFEGGSPTITDNTIIENEASGDFGGGIYCSDSAPVIEGNTISRNIVCGEEGYGGGIYCDSTSSLSIEGNTIKKNEAGYGGGISCIGCSGLINGNVITGNIVGGIYDAKGGGIYCENSSPTIESNLISGNNADGDGGGIYCQHSSPTITGNTISGNNTYLYGSNTRGGGIYCSSSSSPNITGNTITGNSVSGPGGGYGGGIYCQYSSPIITNTILWNNSPNQIFGGPTVTYSDIQGGYFGEGNIDADPMFVQPDTSMYTDYRLLWDSPCIDTGHPDSLDADATRSDIGAHYFNQDDYLTLYLTPDMTEVAPGGQLGVTYTLINRWSQSEPFWGLTQVILPGGNPFNLIGPDPFTLPANTTIQQHFIHNVPTAALLGQYEYQTQIGLPPSTLYDEDRFTFTVNE